jgi:hypothetical protein
VPAAVIVAVGGTHMCGSTLGNSESFSVGVVADLQSSLDGFVSLELSSSWLTTARTG